MNLYHNSRKTEYREPFGAVPVGTQIRLAVKAEGAESVFLRCWQDDLGERVYPMDRNGDRFSCTITAPDHGCLVWYYFIAHDGWGGTQLYGNALDRLGGEGRTYDFEPPSFQITVYKPQSVPAWYKNAIVYQIFPDRFYRGEAREQAPEMTPLRKKNGPQQVLQEDWYKDPSYTKDENGDITEWEMYGGSLAGIAEKFPYLRSLGVTALYLNPIFEAASNHRYDTADYLHIDPMLGTDEDFEDFCRKAKDAGISVILDGVFNHTGRDSRYFDFFDNYDGSGAWNSEDSPYRCWYHFKDEEPGYDSWWGVKDLPDLNEDEPSYRAFICGEDGVIKRWIDAGAKGFRLDVADELPDSFIRDIRSALKSADPEALLLGEVWEDSSNKESHGEKRRYFMGDELDGVMNYPLRSMLLDFARGATSSRIFLRQMMCLIENYPPDNLLACLDLIGSHDRARILTELGTELDPVRAKAAAKMLAALLYALPGVPCIYYGDEAGLTGGPDPENRKGYPWGREDNGLVTYYKKLGGLYHEHRALKDGSFEPVPLQNDVCGFFRDNGNERILVLANRSRQNAEYVQVAAGGRRVRELFTGRQFVAKGERIGITLPPLYCCYILIEKE